MIIGINASFARKPDSGMGNTTINFLKKLVEIVDSRDTILLYLEEDLDLGVRLPKNVQKRVIKTFYPRDDLVRKIYWEKFVLPRHAKRDGCEVFFSFYQSPTIFQDIPHMMMVHDCIPKIFPWYLNNWRKEIYYKQVDKGIEAADSIMTISDHSKIDVARIYKTESPKIITNYEDCDPLYKERIDKKETERILKKFKIESRKFIFYVGGFDMRKNMGGLIEAYGQVWDKYKNKKDCPDLVLAGKFNRHLVPLVTNIEEKIIETRCQFGIPPTKFKLLGFVEQKHLPALYKGASVFCYPSLYEGFGLPVLEAFNCKCPVVTSENSSLKEIANNKNAFIFDLEEKLSLGEKIYECLNAKEKKKKRIEQAHKDAKKFSWAKFTRKVLRELKSLETKKANPKK